MVSDGDDGKSAADATPDGGASTSGDSASKLTMWSGDALTLREASQLAGNNEVRFIFLAGMPDCGKTTLLAAFYERFQRGPFGKHIFAGSRTLVRFEDICHYARIASGHGAPSTQRTRLKESFNL